MQTQRMLSSGGNLTLFVLVLVVFVRQVTLICIYIPPCIQYLIPYEAEAYILCVDINVRAYLHVCNIQMSVHTYTVSARVTDDLIGKLFYCVVQPVICACALGPMTLAQRALFCCRHTRTRIADHGLNLAIAIGSNNAPGRPAFTKLQVSSNIPFVGAPSSRDVATQTTAS